MQERDIMKAFDGITPDKELKEKVLEAIENHKPRKFNWDFSRIVPVALCAVVLVNGVVLFKSLPERNNSVIPLSGTETSSEFLGNQNLNLDLLSEIGLTYSQLKEKYGEPVSVYYSGGEYWYKFENGFENGCGYSWHETDVIYEEGKTRQFKVNGEMELTKEGAPQPKADVGCLYISGFITQDLFLDLEEYIATSEIEKTYGIKHLDTFFVSFFSGRSDEYAATFSYNDIIIQVGTTSEEEGVTLSHYNVSIYHNEWEDKRTVTETAETVAETVAETTQTQEETTVVTETTTEPVIEKKLNLDLLYLDLRSDIGLTYSQLQEKYGKQISAFYENSTMYYVFENSSYAYGWSYGYDGDDFLDEERTLSFPLSERVIRYNLTQEEAPLPKAEVGCGSLNDINCRDLFLGLNEPISISEIEETYGVQWIKKYTIDGGRSKGWEAYLVVFNFEGRLIHVYTKEDGIIDLDSYASISFK